MTKPPQVIEFFLRGFPLECALAILDHWDVLTELDRTLASHSRWEWLTLAERVRLSPYTLACVPAGLWRH